MEFSVWGVMSGLLLIGVTAGFLMHRSDFCMAGAFRDVFLFRRSCSMNSGSSGKCHFTRQPWHFQAASSWLSAHACHLGVMSGTCGEGCRC